MSFPIPSEYAEIVEGYSAQITDYLRQGATTDQLKGRPFVDLTSALTVDVLYLLMVFFGATVGKALLPKLVLYPLRFAYNLTQMMLCAYMSIEAGKLAYNHGYTLTCNKWNVQDPVMANVLYIFYLSKILDFVDTFFIITKQSWKQLSFLHVYHHSSIFMVYWALVNTDTDGDIYWTILLNGFIHFVMYTYYFLALHMPSKDIWWKKYVTQLQLIQFVGMMVQATRILYRGCTDTPVRVIYMYSMYMVTMLCLFSQFYVKSYVAKPSAKKTQ